MKAYTYKGVEDHKLNEEEIPSELLEDAKKLRGELIEKVAEYEDEVLTKFLDG
jgi:elongation factor G